MYKSKLNADKSNINSRSLREIKDSINEIKGVLLGNEYMPIGLLDRIVTIENNIKKFDVIITKVKYLSIGYAAGGAGLGILITKLFV